MNMETLKGRRSFNRGNRNMEKSGTTRDWAERATTALSGATSRFRRSRLAMNPVVIVLLLDLIIYAVLSFLTGNVVPRVGTVFIIVGIAVAAIVRGLGLWVGIVLTIIGGILLYANQVLHLISF